MNEKDKENEEKKPNDEDIELIETEEKTSFLTSDIQKFREKLKLCEKERQEYLDGWQRAKADFVNARRDEEKMRQEFITFAKEDLLSQVITVADSFELAFANKESWGRVDEGWRKGVEYIYSQLVNVLSVNGLKQIYPKGERFDPFSHASIELVEVSQGEEDGKVVEVVQKGYLLNGKIIRPARVKVGEYKNENPKS